MSALESSVREAAELNAQHLATLARTGHAPSTLKQRRERIPDLEKKLPNAKKMLDNTHITAEKELKEWESYRDSKVRRWAHSLGGSDKEAKWDERTAKEKQEYEEVAAKVFKLESKIQSMETELEEAKQSIPQLEADTNQCNEAQTALDSLYDSIFGGPTPDYPHEDQAEETEKQARLECGRVGEAEGQQSKFVEALKKADKALDNALDRLHSAEKASTLDTVGVFDTLAGLHKREAWKSVQTSVSGAKSSLAEAKQINPDMTDLQMENVNVKDKSFAIDIFFDNSISDVDFHVELKAMKDLLTSKSQLVKSSLKTATSELEALQAQKASARDDWKAKKQDLQTVRESIFSSILEKSN